MSALSYHVSDIVRASKALLMRTRGCELPPPLVALTGVREIRQHLQVSTAAVLPLRQRADVGVTLRQVMSQFPGGALPHLEVLRMRGCSASRLHDCVSEAVGSACAKVCNLIQAERPSQQQRNVAVRIPAALRGLYDFGGPCVCRNPVGLLVLSPPAPHGCLPSDLQVPPQWGETFVRRVSRPERQDPE